MEWAHQMMEGPQIDQQSRSIVTSRVPTGGEPSAKNIEEHSIEMHLLAGLPQGRNFHVSTFPFLPLTAQSWRIKCHRSKPWRKSG